LAKYTELRTHEEVHRRRGAMPVPFRIQPPKISEDEPFAECALGRKDFAETLTTFIENASTPLVLALDSGWGSGKTTFLRMWRAQLRLKGISSAYFNAWESDYLEEPLIGLISEFASELKAKEPKQAAKVREAGKRILKTLVPFAARMAAVSLFGPGSGETAATWAEASQSLAESQLNAYEERKRDATTLRLLLEKAAAAAGADAKPFVYLIDELDRCRPTFAIELLERIKHLFEVPGIVFVLALDRTQLQHSIRSVYGAEFDAAGYLRRFFDLVLTLPGAAGEGATQRISGFLGLEAASWPYGKKELQDLTVFTELMATALGASVRQREQIFARIHLALLVRPKNRQEFYPETLALLASLTELRPQWLKDFRGNPAQHILPITAVLYPSDWQPGEWKQDWYRHRLEATVWMLAASAAKVGPERAAEWGKSAIASSDPTVLRNPYAVKGAKTPLERRSEEVEQLFREIGNDRLRYPNDRMGLQHTLGQLELAGTLQPLVSTTNAE
jgi:KAP family P-loop domain